MSVAFTAKHHSNSADISWKELLLGDVSGCCWIAFDRDVKKYNVFQDDTTLFN